MTNYQTCYVWVSGDYLTELKLYNNDQAQMINDWNKQLQLFTDDTNCKIINLERNGSLEIKMTINATYHVVNKFNTTYHWFGRKVDSANTVKEKLRITYDCYPDWENDENFNSSD